MVKEVTATQDQWQWCLWYLGSAAMPDRLGERTFTAALRARIDAEMSEVFDALVPHSHYLQQHGKAYEPCFGAKEDWKRPSEGADLECVAQGKSYTIAFEPKASSGLLWLFTILLTPAHPLLGPDGKQMIDRQTGKMVMSHPNVHPALAARFVWPICAAMDATDRLKRALGIPVMTEEPSFEAILEGAAK